MNKKKAKMGVVAKPVETGFFAAYAEFSKTLRAWLIAYGVGAPILFFQSPDAWAALGKSGEVRPFVYAFLVGIAIQVLSALLYKSAMWYLYMEELQDIPATHWKARISAYVSSAYWLEIGMDLATVCCFGTATVRALIAVVQ
jgi:hypothetical protein